MKMAILDGILYLKDAVNDEEVRLIHSLPARLDKKTGFYIAKASMGVLQKLKDMVGLSAFAAQAYGKLCHVQELIDGERIAAKPVPLVQYPVKFALYEHQVRGANMALLQFGLTEDTKDIVPQTGHGFGFLFEMGCGKTLTTIAVLGTAWQKKKIRRVLVVAPSSVCSVWPKEFDTYAAYPYIVSVLLGAKEKRVKGLKDLEKYPKNALKIAVINYESAWRLQDELSRWKPDAIVCDESQRIKAHDSSQSKGLHELGKIAKYKIVLSGTPVQNSPLDIFSQYKFLDSTVFGENFYTFKSRYAIMGGFENHQVSAYQNMEELTKRTHSIAYRVTKDEALDLPEQTFENRYISFTPKEKIDYEQMRKNSFIELTDGKRVTATVVLTKLLRLQQITGGFVKYDDSDKIAQCGTGKLNALDDIFEDYVIGSGKKLVVFARFIPEIKAIKKLLEKKNIHYSAIWGEIPMTERGEQVRQFQEDEKIKVFVAQIQTAGLGITLTAANTAVYYSLDYNYANYSQSLSRIHRIGQKNACTYINLVVPNTIDELVMQALAAKEDIAKSIVDNWRKYF